MQRLLRKFETAKDLVPRPLRRNADKPTKCGVIYYGSTAPAMDEAIVMLQERGNRLDMLRIRAFPFHQDVADFIAEHEFVFLVEQNRDAQMRSLVVNECGIDPMKIMPITRSISTNTGVCSRSARSKDCAENSNVSPGFSGNSTMCLVSPCEA